MQTNEVTLGALERRIDKLGTQIQRIHDRMADHDPGDYAGLQRLTAEGAGKVGERYVGMVGIRDPYTIAHVDQVIAWQNENVDKSLDTVLSNVSPSELAGALDRWYAKSLGDLPATLAADGKYVRDKAGTLNLCDPYGRTASSTPIKKKGRSRWSRGPRPASSGSSTAAP